MLFSTKRLQVRKLRITDINDLHEMHSNPRVMLYTGDQVKDFKTDKDNLEKIIQKYDQPDNDFWVWAIERKSDQALAGTCAIIKTHFHEYNTDIKYEIGFRFLEKHWGNGYGSELTPALLSYVFDYYKVKVIWAEADVLNEASVKILDKNLVNQGKRWNESDNCWDYHYLLTKEEHDQKRH